jgi:hypothetical protein
MGRIAAILVAVAGCGSDALSTDGGARDIAFAFGFDFADQLDLGAPDLATAPDLALPHKTLSFAPAVDLLVGGTTPQSIAVGDLNGDKHPDLVVGLYGSKQVAVLLGNGGGAFQPAVT